jgi:hypothetical protein
MSSIRERTKAASAKYVREELVTVEGVEYLSIGLVSGEKNRLRQETRVGEDINVAKFSPRLIAMCTCDPETRKQVWNVNSLDDLNEIDALDEAITKPLGEAATRVCGWGADAVKEGKDDSKTTNTSSASTSPLELAAA